MATASSAPAPAPAHRTFEFFTSTQVKDANDLASSPSVFKSGRDSCGYSREYIHFGPAFEPVKSWVAYPGGRATHAVERKGILVTVGEESSSRLPQLKVWDLEHLDNKAANSTQPTLLRSAAIKTTQPHPVMCIALTSSLSHLALAMGDGTVLLYRHFDQSLFSGSALAKPKPAMDGSGEPLPVGPKAKSQSPTVVDEIGTDLGCAAMHPTTGQMLWQRRKPCTCVDLQYEAVAMLTKAKRPPRTFTDTTSSPSPHQSPLRRLIPPHRSKLCRPPFRGLGQTPRSTEPNPAEDLESAGPDISRVAVLDPELAFVAWRGAVSGGVKAVFAAPVPNSTALAPHVRHGAGTRKNRGVDETGVAEIHREYGDYLYGKGDGDGAMAQYIQTIGFVRPSYVIRKFLDAQRIMNLVTYLQVLHSRGLANADHTTLLLNTYTKLKDVDRLDQFIKSEVQRPAASLQTTNASESASSLPFDLIRQFVSVDKPAISNMLRISLRSILDTRNTFESRKYGTLWPCATRTFAGRNHQLAGGAMQWALQPKPTSALDTEFVDSPVSARLLEPPRSKEKLSKEKGKEDPKRRGTLDDKPSLSSLSQTASVVTSVAPSPARAPSPPPPIPPPSPRPFFAHFVAHSKQFVQFLERVADKRWGQSITEQTAVWNTLLELYLTSTHEKTKAIGVLRSGGDTITGSHDPKLPFDNMHALIMCSTFQFTDGLMLLWEQMGMYEDVLRFWMERALDPSIIPSSVDLDLEFLTSTSELLHRHSADVTKILDVIEREKIMPPLGVVQILARNGVASVGLVKAWLMTRINESRSEVESDRKLIESYRTETKAKLQEITELSDPEHPECLPDQDIECPICARQHSVIKEIRRTNERLADAHGVFLSSVAENGFEAVASAFGRGILSRRSDEDNSGISVVVYSQCVPNAFNPTLE
ncbi:Zinc-finger [Rhizoctonia solani]|uniref:Zinc-finger n=1 Tax=Rhizoctonia solani TaxID=456999 RepID=A0A8H7I701_9AGAM|nr:Zinc-finger [Rhizoctonia solani]